MCGVGWGSHALTHPEKMRKMPFKPHRASLGHGYLICVCCWAPSGLHVINMGTLQSRSWNFPQGVWVLSCPGGEGNPCKLRHSACLHTPAGLRLESPVAGPSLREPGAVHTLAGWAYIDRLGKDSLPRWVVTLMVTAPLLPSKGEQNWIFFFSPRHSSTSRVSVRFLSGTCSLALGLIIVWI